MPQLKLKYRFISTAVPEDTFYVLDFQGDEGLSRLFSFELILISQHQGFDISGLLHEPATFTISSESGVLPFHGVLASFSQQQKLYDFIIYKARLVPRFWRLSITRHNQIFLNKTMPDFLTQALEDGGLDKSMDFEFKLQGDYSPRDFVCHYNESHFAFVSRWLEHYGCYYYFDHNHDGRLVLTDTSMAHGPLNDNKNLLYSPPSGLDDTRGQEVAQSFNLHQHPVPQSVLVRDWNYRTPDLQVQGQAEVHNMGRGSVQLYGEHCDTPSECKRIAEVRAQECRCAQQIFHGASGAPFLRSGFTIALQDHYRGDVNQDYLIVSVRHTGSQREYLLRALGGDYGEEAITYRNTFTAIPAETQFRPQRTTPWPRSSGVMYGHVDAAGSGEYAEVDDQGRYKVTLPFDKADRAPGKASSWLRMAQPYCGGDHGFHFPLHKNTEILIGCAYGNIDRPIVLGAVPNPDTPSPVTAANQTACEITTSGKNRIHFQDQDGEQRMLLHCPAHETYWRMGHPNDPPPSGDGKQEETGFVGHKLYTGKALDVRAGSAFTVIMGNSSETYLGLDFSTYSPFYLTFILGFEIGMVLAFKQSIKPIHNRWKETEDSLRAAETHESEVASRFVQEMNTLRGQITTLADNITHLSEENTQLAGTINRVAQAKTRMAQRKINLCEDITELTEDINVLAEQKTVVCEQVTKIQQSSVRVAQEVTRLTQQNTLLANSVTRLCEEQTELMQEVQYVGTSVNNLAEFINTL